MYEKAGYTIEPFVTGFLETPAGPVPKVSTRPDSRDWIGRVLTRIGITRNNYRVTPGLYAVGAPDKNSPVLVTANYKLSFDAVRFGVNGLSAWLLVADTRGINVWCAAGKGTFSTDEIITVARQSALEKIAPDATLVLPQLGATGVCASQIKKACGLKTCFGPVRVADIPAFLKNGLQADEKMRSVTFSFAERAELVPVELYLKLLPLLVLFPVLFFVSGIGSDLFSFERGWSRGLTAWVATLGGLISGSVLVPLFLPLLPGRHFWLKGILVSGGVAALFTWLQPQASWLDTTALVLWLCAIGSYQSMSFTGSTPFTSPSGVEYEMRRGLAIQIVAIVIAIILWLVAPFSGK